MKLSIKARSGLVIVFLGGIFSTLVAQIPDDPFEGQYSIARSAEAFLLEIVTENPSDPGLWTERFDFNENADIIRAGSQLFGVVTDDDWKCMDAVCGDFAGISRDYLASVITGGTNSAVLAVFDVAGPALQLKDAMPNFEYTPNNVRCTRVITANLDHDPQQEIVLAYAGADKKINIKIYELQSVSHQLVELGANNEIPLARKEHNNIELDDVGDAFDIAALDVNGDQKDEIIMVHKLDFKSSTRELFYEIVCYDLDGTLKKTITNLDTVKLDFGSQPAYYNHPLSRVGRPSLACGDLDGDRTEEIVLGYVVSTRWDHGFVSSKSDLDIVEVLGMTQIGESICLSGPKVIGSYNHDGHSQNSSRNHFSRTVACADFTKDGKDEIVCDGPDSLYILAYEQSGIRMLAGMPCSNHPFYDHRDRSFAVADVNPCTSDSVWTKEIVYLRYLPDLKDRWGKNMPEEITLGIAVPEVKDGEITGLTEATSELIRPGAFSTTHHLRYVLVPGDFDGDGFYLGPPVSLPTLTDVEEPRIIINAPPVHFDMFDGVPYDICSVFDDDGGEFATSYTHQEGQVNEVQSEIVRDWGISSSLRKVFKISETGIDATFEGRYGQYFSNVNVDSESYETITSIPAQLDDWIYTTLTDYYMWEYPVYENHQEIGEILVVIPEYKGGNWFPSKSQKARNIIQHHELGNILSYSKLNDMPEDDSLRFSGPAIELNNESGKSWTIDINKVTTNNFSRNMHFGFSSELLLSEGGKVGIDLQIFDFDIETKTEFGVKGQYDQTEIMTHAMSVSEGINVRMDFGALDQESFDDEVNFDVKPYVYWSINGTFVVDYIVNPSRGVAGDTTWWDRHYASHPDLAFILPWRYDKEKGIPGISESKRTQTKDIIFVPTYPEPGDTVRIITRIHNYSLMALNKNFTLQYFLGDPENGGTEMSVSYDNQESSKITISEGLQERGESAYCVTWVVPSDIEYRPRIYAVLDPDNEIIELHEDNNKGNAFLEIKGVVDVTDDGEKVIPKDYSLEQNYPNPFNPSTWIRFGIPRTEEVKIEIYNIMGQKVVTLLNERLVAGVHQIEFTQKNLASGIYFYQITAGDFVSTKKMIRLD